jgi:hypothetical protein
VDERKGLFLAQSGFLSAEREGKDLQPALLLNIPEEKTLHIVEVGRFAYRFEGQCKAMDGWIRNYEKDRKSEWREWATLLNEPIMREFGTCARIARPYRPAVKLWSS